MFDLFALAMHDSGCGLLPVDSSPDLDGIPIFPIHLADVIDNLPPPPPSKVYVGGDNFPNPPPRPK